MSNSSKKRKLNNHSEDATPPSKQPKLLDQSSLGSIVQNLYKTINNGSMHDVTFLIGAGNNIQEFSATRALFAAQSDIFKGMLYGGMKESNTENKVIIPDISPIAFACIRDICYFSNPIIEYKTVVEVLYAARKYMINSLIELCVRKLMQTENNDQFYSLMESFAKYSPSTFDPYFGDFISKSEFIKAHMTEIIKDKERFYKLNIFQMQCIIKSNVIENSQTEYRICKTFCKLYCNKNTNNNGNNSWQCLMNKYFVDHINFSKMNVTDLVVDVRKDAVVSDTKLVNAIADQQRIFSKNDYLLSKWKARRLKMGDKVDARMSLRSEFHPAIVTKKDNDSLTVKFLDIDSVEQDFFSECVIALSNVWEFGHIAEYGVVSKRKISRECMKHIKRGDNIMVNKPYCLLRSSQDFWIQCKVDSITDCNQFIVRSRDFENLCVHPDCQDECKLCDDF